MPMAGQLPFEPPEADPGAGPHLRIPPTRLRGPDAARPAVIVLVAGIALIAAGIGATLLADHGYPSPPDSSASRPAPVAVVAPATSPSAQPPPTSTFRGPMVLPPRLGRTELTERIFDGSLDGRLVFVDGILHSSPVVCPKTPGSPHPCMAVALDGFGLPVVAGASALLWPGDPDPGELLVFVAEHRGLTYLGSLGADIGGPLPIDELTRRLLDGRQAERLSTLFEVEGYLLVDPGRSCGASGPDATPCSVPLPFIADDESTAEGSLASNRGAAVNLERTVVGWDPATAVTHGRFLVVLSSTAGCRLNGPSNPCTADGVRWTVVARYDPGRAVRAVIP